MEDQPCRRLQSAQATRGRLESITCGKLGLTNTCECSHMNSRRTFEFCVEKFADLVHWDVVAKPSLQVHRPIVYDVID